MSKDKQKKPSRIERKLANSDCEIELFKSGFGEINESRRIVGERYNFVRRFFYWLAGYSKGDY